MAVTTAPGLAGGAARFLERHLDLRDSDVSDQVLEELIAAVNAQAWSDVERKLAFLERLEARKQRPPWRPLPHQVAPSGDDWEGWVMLGGRGSGKTDGMANYVKEHVAGPPCLRGPMPHLVGIIAPTLGDAVTACWVGPSGLRAHDATARMVTRPGGILVVWENGSQAKLFGADGTADVDRLRAGGNTCLVWAEELAAWRHLQEAWDQMSFGLRSGPNPRWVASTTPRPRPLIKKLNAETEPHVVVTRATMFDNPHLPAHIRQKLLDAYDGTTKGAQELHGRVVDEDENALWKRTTLERWRVKSRELVPPLARVSVGVDPSGGAGEQGIVVSGKAMLDELRDGRPVKVATGFVLADYSCKLPPDGWGRRAVQAAIDHEADDIVVERNFGGDMATATVRAAAEAMGVTIKVNEVHASRGKRPRAEPVAAKSEQGRWRLVGEHEQLEDQMTTWYPELDWSPDRLDGMVWTAWDLKVVSLLAITGKGSFGGAVMASRSLAPGA